MTMQRPCSNKRHRPGRKEHRNKSDDQRSKQACRGLQETATANREIQELLLCTTFRLEQGEINIDNVILKQPVHGMTCVLWLCLQVFIFKPQGQAYSTECRSTATGSYNAPHSLKRTRHVSSCWNFHGTALPNGDTPCQQLLELSWHHIA
jgi:hypothetical protein